MEKATQVGCTSGKNRPRRSKPKWQSHVISSLFTITLLLVLGFFVQESLRWLT